MQGADPIHWAVETGEKVRKATGCKAMRKPAAPDAALTCEHVGDAPIESLLWRLPFAHGSLHPRTLDTQSRGTGPAPSFKEGQVIGTPGRTSPSPAQPPRPSEQWLPLTGGAARDARGDVRLGRCQKRC